MELENVEQEIEELLHKGGDASYEDMMLLDTYVKDKIENYDTKDLVPLVDLFYKNFYNKIFFYPERVRFNLLMMKIFDRANMSWRGRKFADDSYTIVSNNLETIKKDKSLSGSIFYTHALFYMSIVCPKKAAFFFHLASDFYFDVTHDVKEASWCKRKEIIALQYLPKKERELPSKDEIKKKYGEYSNIVIDAIEGKGFPRRDPVEQTPEFQSFYDEMNEKVLKKVNECVKNNQAYDVVKIKKEILKEHGINWKSTTEINSIPDFTK